MQQPFHFAIFINRLIHFTSGDKFHQSNSQSINKCKFVKPNTRCFYCMQETGRSSGTDGEISRFSPGDFHSLNGKEKGALLSKDSFVILNQLKA